MKPFLKKNVFLLLTFLFIFLLFQFNTLFKTCILNGCLLFMEQVFPFLFPMFIANDFLMNYRFEELIEKTIHKLFKPIFGFSSLTSSIFVLSMFSGTPTNAYLISNLVKEKKLKREEASIIVSYSCFLNPLFLYSILTTIFFDQKIVFKLILVEYFLNFLIAFTYRKYPYAERKKEKETILSFSQLLPKSLKRSLNTLLLILGTILFYLLLCESLNLFFPNALLNCFLNGLLEATGGLLKLISLNCSLHLKEILASIFISFTGFSIHTQIKNILEEEHICTKPFLKARIIHAFLSAGILLIMP